MQLSGRNRLLFYGAVPLLAVLVAVRQGYLSGFSELSTWKGGGMGMFASADSTATRFIRWYIETPDGKRQPIVGLTDAQATMQFKLLWYPTDAAFKPLARSLRATSFVASKEPSAVFRFSELGDEIERLEQRYYLLHANKPRAADDAADWTLIAEYYRLSYDPLTRTAKFTLVKTLRFPPESD